jgi:hypothetical protein
MTAPSFSRPIAPAANSRAARNGPVRLTAMTASHSSLDIPRRPWPAVIRSAHTSADLRGKQVSLPVVLSFFTRALSRRMPALLMSTLHPPMAWLATTLDQVPWSLQPILPLCQDQLHSSHLARSLKERSNVLLLRDVSSVHVQRRRRCLHVCELLGIEVCRHYFGTGSQQLPAMAQGGVQRP